MSDRKINILLDEGREQKDVASWYNSLPYKEQKTLYIHAIALDHRVSHRLHIVGGYATPLDLQLYDRFDK